MNNNHAPISESAKNVLTKIIHGEIAMRSKWQFIWKAVAIGAVVLVAFLVSTFVVSFIIFASKASGHRFLLSFGSPGLKTFLILFPWKLLALAILLFVLLRVLLRRFRWGYRHSFIAVFGAVTAASVVAGSLVSATSLHSTLLRASDRDDLPILNEFYQSLRQPLREHEHGIYTGTVAAVFDGGFMLTHEDKDADSDEGIITVHLPSDEQETFSIGDTVFVAGEEEDEGVIDAYGVQKVNLADPTLPRYRLHEEE